MSDTNHTYKKNYLKQVIFRADFDSISLGNFDSYKKNATGHFDETAKKKGKVASVNFDMDSETVVKNTEEFDIWSFEDSQSKNKLDVSINFCVLEYSSYKNSSQLKGDINIFLDSFFTMHNIKEVKRIGLRYVNEVNLTNIKRLDDWSNYISNDLLTHTTFSRQKRILTRVLNQVEFKDEDFSTVFKYGIWNDKYPSPITTSAFILDIDCSTRLPVTLEDKGLGDYASMLNDEARSIFEASITDNLRKEMEKI